MLSSQPITAGGLVYVSGITGGAGSIAVQTRSVIERMADALTAAGSSLDQALAVMVYLTSAADFAPMNDVYKTCWTTEPPTRTTIVTDLLVPGALVEMSVVAADAHGERSVIHPSTWLRSPSPYSYAITSGDAVFLSGLVSRNGRDNAVVTGDVAAQTRTIMDNAGELLAAAGLTHDHIVSARVYLTDGSTFSQMNSAYRPYFRTAPPARATVLTGLAGSQYAVEMTFIASSATRVAIDAPATTNPNLSAAIRAGNRVYMSGVLGNTAENVGNVAAQTRETLSRIRAGLAAAGASPADVVETLVYLTDLKAFDAMDAEYRSFVEREAACTFVRSGLVAPDGLVEIMMTAVTR